MENIANLIKAEADSLGFSFIKFTGLDQPPHFEAFIEWLNSGYSGDMQYLSTSRTIQSRKDPASLLEDAKSIIVFGFNYAPQTINHQKTDLPIGLIASYAVFEDYHKLLKQQARQLMQNISQQSESAIAYRLFIDSAPLMEKDTAYMAGSGWIGKNSLLITPTFGSFQLLGCILTNLTLPSEAPFEQNLCGSCHQCINTCPTNCISNNHFINAGRCIAYLTIEYKGIIPRDLRSKMGNWIFGCDCCQNICPINDRIYKKDNLPQQAFSLFSPQVNAEVNLINEIKLTPQEFKQKYQNTPVLRAKHEGFLRNIIIAMGNSKSLECIPSLTEILFTNPAWLLRLHAAWALGEMHTSASIQAIQDQLNKETDSRVKDEIAFILSHSD